MVVVPMLGVRGGQYFQSPFQSYLGKKAQTNASLFGMTGRHVDFLQVVPWKNHKKTSIYSIHTFTPHDMVYKVWLIVGIPWDSEVRTYNAPY